MKVPMAALRRLVGRALPQGYVDDVVRRRRIAESIRQSGLFDPEWYKEQFDGEIPPETDLIDHYVTVGSSTDVSPNPVFTTKWYRDHKRTPNSLDVAPFVHYVNRGMGRGLPPHPLFDPAYYTAAHPESDNHPGGPLGHYLEIGWKQGAQPSAAFDPAVYERKYGKTTEAPLVDFIRHMQQLIGETEGHEAVPRTSESFDHATAEAFKRGVVDEYRRSGDDDPLVSVIIPTKDRARGVVEAIESVQAQTYRTWQLVVVDDGSTDDTVATLEPILADDPRIELVQRERAGGVSVARNVGLQQARGEYIAYLDSDNTWLPDFLEVMVAFVRTRSLRFGYAASELVEEKEDGRRAYRSMPFNREALRERNFIDCIVVLHERSLLDEVGAFDEKLRRNVDWELFIRMSNVTDFEHAPFIATRYDAWEERSDRITINESFGYRYVILGKHLIDWGSVESEAGERQPGSVSVVIHAPSSAGNIIYTVQRLLEVTDGDIEIVIVDSKTSEAEAMRLQLLSARYPEVRIVRQTLRVSRELAQSIGVAHSTGEIVVFMPADAWVEPGWLEPLVAPLREGAAAATQPRVLALDGTVWSAGVAFARGALPHSLFRRFPGDAPEVVRPATPAALSPNIMAARAYDLARVRGFEPLFVNDIDNPDLSIRLARECDRELRYVPDSVVALSVTPQRKTKSGAALQALDNQELFTARWKECVTQDDVAVWKANGYAIIGYDGAAATHWGFDPILVHDRPERPLRWAIKIGASDVPTRYNWGDWFFAIALKEAFERLGHEAVIDTRRSWYRSTSRLDDVTLVLRGVSPYRVNPQQINLSWIISHPERVTKREIGMYDAVFAASTSLAQHLSADLGSTVEPLLQCTDQYRFYPVEPDEDRRHDVLFVGNARGVRASVAAALEAGIVPSVYGVRWDDLLPQGAWKGEFIPNEYLPGTYTAAGVVLNDHWEDMKDEGLLSNRLFDLAACGARAVTDDVPGVSEVFGDIIPTYRTPDELAAAVATQLSEAPERAQARMDLSKRVRREHSFDARAESLVESVRKLQADKDFAREV